MSSCLTLRQSRSMNRLSIHRPRPSMLTSTPADSTASRYASLVNWLARAGLGVKRGGGGGRGARAPAQPPLAPPPLAPPRAHAGGSGGGERGGARPAGALARPPLISNTDQGSQF